MKKHMKKNIRVNSELTDSSNMSTGIMIEDNKNKNSVELEASLAPAEAEVGAVAKADQYSST